MKIKAKNFNLKSTKIIVPFDGLIDIDANGEAEVSSKAGEILVNGTSDWDLVSEVNEDDEVDEKDVAAGIKKMTIAEMVAVATDAEYPESEWKKFSTKPKLMAGYLIKKFNEIQAQEEDKTEE